MMREVTRTFVVLVGVWVAGVVGIEHNLPEGVELVDPKDLGLDSQIDLDKLLGNVKALPIDGNALSSALGKPGLKTQVLTVGFDGSEGINLDDFELPQLKNDEHGPLAQAAFSSFKNFFKNSTSASPVEAEPQKVTTHRPGGKRRQMVKRRKVKNGNGTTTTTTSTSTPPPDVQVPHEPDQNVSPAVLGPTGPKVIELDSSQIEKLIASGKIGPPKTFGQGGPQIIELGQKDLDALLSSANGDELKQILEGGEPVKDFDLSQITGSPSLSTAATAEVPSRVTESYQRVSLAAVTQTPRPAVEEPPVLEVASTQTPLQTTRVVLPTTEDYVTSHGPPTTPPPNLILQHQPQDNNAGQLPIIYQYNSAQDNRQQFQQQQFQRQQHQPIQSQVPLQSYSGSVNGEQQAKFVKHPTFEFISAPPVSFSSSVQPSNEGNNNNQINNAPVPPLPPQIPPVLLQSQQHQQFRNTFISPASSQFIPAGAPPSSPSNNEVPISSPQKPSHHQSLNKIVPAKQQSAHTEQFKPSSSISHLSSQNFIPDFHQVNLPVNSIKLATPSPQTVQTLLSQVPASFSPALAPSHIVNSPVVDPLHITGGHQQFIPNEPFRNTQLFSTPKRPPPPPPPPQARNPIASTSHFRFPGASTTTSAFGGANRFRTAESSNPYFNYATAGQNPFPNLVLNSFFAGDGLNYRPNSNQAFVRPGI